MKKIVLASVSPVKISAVKKVADVLHPGVEFEYVSLSFEKDGPEPIGRAQILLQIQEAIDACKKEVPDADYYVSMEGGMEIYGTEMHENAYVVVESSAGGKGVSACASFRVPTWVAEQVQKGVGFADAVDEFYTTQGTKLGGGFVKILTGGAINKKDHYTQSLTIAFASADKKEWYL